MCSASRVIKRATVILQYPFTPLLYFSPRKEKLQNFSCVHFTSTEENKACFLYIHIYEYMNYTY